MRPGRAVPEWLEDQARIKTGRVLPPVTRHLARLADISYRRRGRMVLAWILASVVIIGVGSSLAGEYNADYNTPGSESKAASVRSIPGSPRS